MPGLRTAGEPHSPGSPTASRPGDRHIIAVGFYPPSPTRATRCTPARRLSSLKPRGRHGGPAGLRHGLLTRRSTVTKRPAVRGRRALVTPGSCRRTPIADRDARGDVELRRRPPRRPELHEPPTAVDRPQRRRTPSANANVCLKAYAAVGTPRAGRAGPPEAPDAERDAGAPATVPPAGRALRFRRHPHASPARSTSPPSSARSAARPTSSCWSGSWRCRAGAGGTHALAALERFELAGAARVTAQRGRRGPPAPARARPQGRRAHAQRPRAVERALAGFARLDRRRLRRGRSRATTRTAQARARRRAARRRPMGVRRRRRSSSATSCSTCWPAARPARVTAYLTNGIAGRRREHGTRPSRGAAGAPRLPTAAPRRPPATSSCTASTSSTRSCGSACLCPHGKLPNELLARHLSSLAATDDAVLVPAGVGEDVTALDVGGVDTLVAHGDPITLTSGELGRYAVLVNANDIAASGAEPRWLLTTVLLPTGTTPSQALALLARARGRGRRAGHRPRRRPHRGDRRRHAARGLGDDARRRAPRATCATSARCAPATG